MCGLGVQVPQCRFHVEQWVSCALYRTVYTMEEAAENCSLHRTTMTRHAMNGHLQTHLIGERRLTTSWSLSQFIKAGRSGSSGTRTVPSELPYKSHRSCAKLIDVEHECSLLHTVEDGARILRVHQTTLQKFVSCGELGSVLLGRARRVSAFELWRFFENRADGKSASIGEEA